MSSKPMGDAQPEAVAGVDHTLPTNIVDNIAGTGATQTAERPPDAGTEAGADAEADHPDAGTDADPASETGTGPETTTEPEPDETGETCKAGETTETGKAGEAAETAEAAEAAETGKAAELLATAHPADATEPAESIEMPESIEMSEPVRLAEPVEEPGARRRGHGLLIGAAFVLAAIAIVGGAFAIVGSLTHGFKKPVIITYKKSAIFSLRASECINPNGQTASVIPCSTPHEAEVFATFALAASKWPGEAAVRAEASSGCASRLTGYLNPQLAISLSTTYVYPDSVAWQAGTRTVICEVRATSGKLTGSVSGASAS